jgi:quinol-cytochrome oxidoreductase complex cytochrome b subunit
VTERARTSDPTTSAATARDAAPAGAIGAAGGERPYFPGLALKEALAALALLAVLVLLAALTEPALQAAADPNAAGYVPRPEWYFFWFFQLLKYFGGSFEVVGVVLVPSGLIVLLMAVPFIDRRTPRTRVLVAGSRPVRVVPRLLAAAFIAAVLGLTLLAVGSSSAPGEFMGPQGPAPEWPPPAATQEVPAP